MIVLIRRFRFRDELTEDEKAETLRLIRRTVTLGSARFGIVGQCLGDRTDGCTHAYSTGFDDLAALETYLYDPVHLAGDPDIVPHYAKLVLGPDVSDDPDPDLAAKIMAIHDRKLAAYPDYAELMAGIPEVRFL
ncbi:Dabb family protein [Nocardia arthritidis]|uniref:Dabb family protein n=1 Tax=Nocardia arthritidis TaxID=228602 RepID=A0A6G9YB09_9NOCA|nr:Dabb family protein [Nocardia arthritidis]QIS10401.1 Dabb family protein [Nocardia arthritidis]